MLKHLTALFLDDIELSIIMAVVITLGTVLCLTLA
jgi:hypothetical protein